MRTLVIISALTSIALAGSPLLPAPEPYADEYVLVRKDVWDKVDGDSQKLELCAKDLAGAEDSIKSQDRALKSYVMATDMLKDQKAELKKFGDDMLATAKMQREYIAKLESYTSEQSFADQAANVWEWADGPISFAGGFGLCLATVYALQPAFGSQP